MVASRVASIDFIGPLRLGDHDATLAVAFLQTMQTTVRLMHQQ